jgi:hypothetical protein
VVKKVEALANVAIIITAIVLCAVLAKKHLFAEKQARPSTVAAAARSTAPHTIKPGEKISISGVNWDQNGRTLLVALSTTCRFCTESAPFYQLLEKEKLPNLHLLAVLPQPPDEGRKYLTKLGLKLPDVIQSSLASLGISGTPTLILVDKNGLVKQSWVGKLAEADSAKLIAELKKGT